MITRSKETRLNLEGGWAFGVTIYPTRVLPPSWSQPRAGQGRETLSLSVYASPHSMQMVSLRGNRRRFHALQHTFATRFLRQGGSFGKLQDRPGNAASAAVRHTNLVTAAGQSQTGAFIAPATPATGLPARRVLRRRYAVPARGVPRNVPRPRPSLVAAPGATATQRYPACSLYAGISP